MNTLTTQTIRSFFANLDIEIQHPTIDVVIDEFDRWNAPSNAMATNCVCYVLESALAAQTALR